MSKTTVLIDLDEEDLTDPEELVGDIELHGSEGGIYGEAVYLDSWLLGLEEGVEAVGRGESREVEVLEETYPLRFQPSGKGFVLSFRDTTARFPSTAKFAAALTQAAAEIIQRLTTLGLRETPATRALAALARRWPRGD